MENDYGVGVSNRYDVFLEEEEDPLEMLNKQEQLKELKKKPKGPVEKENRSTVTKVEPVKGKPVAPVVKKQIKETQNLKSVEVSKSKEDNKAIRGPRNAPSVKFAPESREERNNRRNREDRNLSQNDSRDAPRENRGSDGRADRNEDAETRGRGRGGTGRGRGGRGSYRGATGEFRPKREFDRHSGSDKSGVKPVDKRDGGGAHNWGTYRDEINEQIDSTYLNQDSSAEWSPEKLGTEPSPGTAPQDPTVAADVKDAEAVEGGDGNTSANEESPVKELTLDEWKALRGNRQKPTFNIRKAGEGEDPSQWKKMYALNKKKEGEEEDDEDDEYELAEYPQRVGRQKHLLEIDIHFSDSRRGGRMRGGRGGLGRGERPGNRGGGDAGPKGGDRAPVVNDSRSADSGGDEAPEVTADRGPDVPRGARGGRGGRASRGANFYANNNAQGARTGRGSYNRQQQSAPKVDDEKDFPSLG